MVLPAGHPFGCAALGAAAGGGTAAAAAGVIGFAGGGAGCAAGSLFLSDGLTGKIGQVNRGHLQKRCYYTKK